MKLQMRWLLCLILFMVMPWTPAFSASAINSIAFYYGPNPPLSDLQAFDIAVVEPAYVQNPRRHARAAKDGAHELFAYVALGEVQPSRPYYRDLPPGALRGSNEAWGSRVIDQTASGWTEFFLNRVIAPLWEQGWRGFFIDTLDSYQLFAATDAERAKQAQAIVHTLRELKRRYPGAKLILNRGFELMPQVADLTLAVAAESLYEGYDARHNRYRPVPEADRAWLLAQLDAVRQRYGLPVIAIDYVDPMQPGARELARKTAKRIRANGFVPWVADGKLESLGVSSVEVQPRTVLVIVRGNGQDLHYVEAQRFLGMPLNHLGLRYEIVDLSNQSLPDQIMSGRYAGVVTWMDGPPSARLVPWLRKRMQEGVRVAIFNAFGFSFDTRWAGELGLRTFNLGNPGRLSVQSYDRELIGMEAEPIPERGLEVPVKLIDGAGRSLLRLSDARGNEYDAAVLTPWGGYVLAPFAVTGLSLQDQTRWVVNPFTFLRQALDLPLLPVPDVTTEGGRRILMVHMDGDGFVSRAEIPGTPYAGEVLLKEFLERYRVPATISVIEAEIGKQGTYPFLAPQLEGIARRIFALPHVEAASHSFSHPFNWAGAVASQANAASDGEARYHLDVPGYVFNLEREIKGSIEYINSKLMPPGKKASVFLWTGNCVPPAVALAATYQYGVLNMNGGDTLITESNKTLTAVAANGIRKGGYYQVYAPNQNENLYTNEWQGPFYGFERVLETFKLTEEPVRYKPINIYFHTYAATKPASIMALHRVFRWALAQNTTPIYASQYIRKVLDFEHAVMARDLASGDLIVRLGADLRTLRIPHGGAVPSISKSTGLAGIAPGPANDYLILAAAEIRLVTASDHKPAVYLQEANGAVSELERPAAGAVHLRFALTSTVAPAFTLAHAGTCSVKINGMRLTGSRDRQGNIPLMRYAAPGAAPNVKQWIEVHCPS